MQGGDPEAGMAASIWGSICSHQKSSASDGGKWGEYSPLTDGGNLILNVEGVHVFIQSW